MSEVEAQLVHALDLHKSEIARLRWLVCECSHQDDFPAYMHDDDCPANPAFGGPPPVREEQEVRTETVPEKLKRLVDDRKRRGLRP